MTICDLLRLNVHTPFVYVHISEILCIRWDEAKPLIPRIIWNTVSGHAIYDRGNLCYEDSVLNTFTPSAT